MKITTNTGKEFEVECVVTHTDPDICYIILSETDIITAVSVFSDSNETAVLRYGDKIYEGYTKFASVDNMGNALKVRLKKDG